MKFFALFVVIFALTSSAMALKNEVCGLPDSANGTIQGERCAALFLQWTYKKDANECERFIYGGCDGNANRFESKEECEKTCKE